MGLFSLGALLLAQFIVQVPGLTCPTCVKPVKDRLSGIEGVKTIKIDWRTQEVRIEFDEKKTSQQAIFDRLKDTPFSAVLPTAGKKDKTTADYLTISNAPAKPDAVAVLGKATILAICTPGCEPCKTLKTDLALFAQRVSKVAIRIIVVDSPKHPAAQYLPDDADIPYVFVFDPQGKRVFVGPAEDGLVMYQAAEKSL